MATTSRHQQINVRETAHRLGVHENTVRNWASRGILHPYRLPGSGFKRFDVVDVDRLAREMREAVAPVEEAKLTRPKKVRRVSDSDWV